MSEKTARFLRTTNGGTNGDARLYELSDPVETPRNGATSYVIVSAVAPSRGCWETVIFPAYGTGEAIASDHLPGSQRDIYDHAKAMAGLGYTVMRNPWEKE